MARVSDEKAVAVGVRCANCEVPLAGPFCANCGQAARDLHRPLRTLLSEAAGEVFSLDARLLQTVRPLLLKPGQVTKEYLSGRRAAYVSPLRMYLIAALIFFGLFSVFETKSPPVYVFITGSVEAEQVASVPGGKVTIELPQHVWFGDERFQEVSARARANQANKDAFATAGYRNIPRAFALFVPVFALMLGLFYWKHYYIDHLMFALYFHAFLFLGFAMLFAVWDDSWMPERLALPLRWAIGLWIVASLPIALRRVYGSSRFVTALKTIGFVFLYFIGFAVFGFGFVTAMAVLTF